MDKAKMKRLRSNVASYRPLIYLFFRQRIRLFFFIYPFQVGSPFPPQYMGYKAQLDIDALISNDPNLVLFLTHLEFLFLFVLSKQFSFLKYSYITHIKSLTSPKKSWSSGSKAKFL